MITRHGTSAARTAQSVRAAAGILLLALVAASPWPFGCASPSGQFALALGILALVGLWAWHVVLSRRFTYRLDAVSACLLGLVLFTAFQLVPLPASVARALSPKAVEWQRALIPETPELLPGEAEADVPRRSDRVRLSVAPSATEDLLAQFLAVFLVYAAARNFATDHHSLRRLAWVGFACGTGLALVAILQYLSGDREQIYWQYDTGAPVFGPFVNKNHFAYQIHLFGGLTIGLFLRVARREGPSSPLAIGLLGGLGLMVAAVGFSESRGGVISLVAGAIIAWAVTRLVGKDDAARDRKVGLFLVGGVALLALGLVAWLGWGTTADRVASLWQGKADNRTPVWRRAWPLVQQFPLVGVGGGGYSAAELATRTVFEGSFLSTTAHNEYLEAAIEGGVVRFALTVALALAAVGVAIRGYRRTRDPLVLGCVFGLGAVAVHSVGDFGLHVPSIAIAAAAVTACAAVRQKVEVRRQRAEDKGQGAGARRQRAEDDGAEGVAADARPTLTGGAAYAAAAFLVLAALVVVLSNWRLYRVDELRVAAAQMVLPENAIRFLEVAARVRPDDPDVWDNLASAHLQAAVEKGRQALTAAAGGAVLIDAPDVLPAGDPDGHVAAALKAARAGRNAQPLVPGPHLRLGTFAARLARTEPAAVHFGRAKIVGLAEPDVWYVAGRAAADRGDWPAAMADWRVSLSQSPRRLVPIARQTAGRIPPDAFRSQVLPDDPAVWFQVTPVLFPGSGEPERAKWLRAIHDRCTRTEPTTAAGFLAWGRALEELNDGPGAVNAWRRAAEQFPDNVQLRDHQAARLEAEERYEEAVPVLEWLAAVRPDNGGYGYRLDAAKHGMKLKREINGP